MAPLLLLAEVADTLLRGGSEGVGGSRFFGYLEGGRSGQSRRDLQVGCEPIVDDLLDAARQDAPLAANSRVVVGTVDSELSDALLTAGVVDMHPLAAGAATEARKSSHLGTGSHRGSPPHIPAPCIPAPLEDIVGDQTFVLAGHPADGLFLLGHRQFAQVEAVGEDGLDGGHANLEADGIQLVRDSWD